MPATLDSFVDAYVTAMLWSSLDNNDNPLDDQYTPDDLAPEALETIRAECASFLEKASTLLDQCAELEASGEWSVPSQNCDMIEYAGHDFWLTRCGHGCGFWDGDWPDGIDDQLTEAAKEFGEQTPYVGDDGQIYLI